MIDPSQLKITIIDSIGIVGVLMVLYGYLCIQLDYLHRTDLSFSLINFIGSILILVSLLHTMNIASFIIEIAWLLISACGIHRCLKHRKANLQ